MTSIAIPTHAPPTASYGHKRTKMAPHWYAAFAALLVAAIALASIGTHILPDRTPPTPPLAPYNHGLANLMTAESYGCDFSAPPLNAGQFPVANTTSLFITPAGELRLFCPSEESDGYFHQLAGVFNDPSRPMPPLPESTLIAEGVRFYQQTPWPETVTVFSPNPDLPQVNLYNVATGESLELEYDPAAIEHTAMNSSAPPSSGKWWVLPDPATTRLMLVDLETLKTRFFGDLANTQNADDVPMIGSSSQDGSITAFLYAETASGGDGATNHSNQILFLDESGASRIVFVPTPTPASYVFMSPDGSYLALASSSPTTPVTGVSIIETSSGNIVAMTEMNESDSISEFGFTLDSTRFVYLQSNTLRVLEPANSADPRTVWQGDGVLSNLAFTADPDRVAVNAESGPDLDTWVLNLSNENAIQLEGNGTASTGSPPPGVIVPLNAGLPTPAAPTLGVFMITEGDGAEQTVELVDPLTGESLATSVPDPEVDRMMLAGPFVTSTTTYAVINDAPAQVVILPDNDLVVLRREGDLTSVTRLPTIGAPEMFPSDINISQSGYAVVHYADGDTLRGFVALLTPEPKWLEVPANEVVIYATPMEQMPSAPSTCDFTEPPLILNANSFPLNAYSVIMTDEGEVRLRCPDQLGQPVFNTAETVSATNMPQTILINAANLDEPQSVLLNLETQEILPVNGIDERIRRSQPFAGPWYVDVGQETEPRIIDLRTLQTTDIQELTDHPVPEDAGVIASANPEGTITAIALVTPPNPNRIDSSYVVESDEFPLQILLVGESLDDHRWLELEPGLGRIVSFIISPNGEYIALHMKDDSPTSTSAQAGEVVIIDASSGDVVARTAADNEVPVTAFMWTADSTRLVYLNGLTVDMLEPGASTTPMVAASFEGQVVGLLRTRDPNVVLVSAQPTLQSQTRNLYRIDLPSGEVESLGVDWSVFIGRPSTVDPGATVFALERTTTSETETTTEIIDPANGEIIASFSTPIVWETDATPVVEPTISANAVPEGTITVVAAYTEPVALAPVEGQGRQALVRTEEGDTHAIQIPLTPSELEGPFTFYVYSDRYILLTGVIFGDPDISNPLYILDLTNPEPEWVPVD